MSPPERARAAEVKRALDELDAWLLRAPSRVRSALKRGLGPGAKHTQLHWAATALGARLPHDLRALYGWHNGQRGAGTFFARLLEHECADYLVGEPARAYTFLSLAAMVRRGAVAGARRVQATLSSAELADVAPPAEPFVTYSFGRGDGADATFYVPFAVASVGCGGGDGDEADEAGEADEEGGRTLFLETLGGAVLMWDDRDDDARASHIEPVAASLAELLERALAHMQAGRIPLPSATPPPRTPRQAVDASARLVQALLEARFLALSATTPASELAEALRPRLAKRRDALGEVTRFLMEDPRVEEVFAEEETLQRLVAEFVGR